MTPGQLRGAVADAIESLRTPILPAAWREMILEVVMKVVAPEHRRMIEEVQRERDRAQAIIMHVAANGRNGVHVGMFLKDGRPVAKA